ncbi:MAG: extracellular solute-binding protein [Clostridiales bacterium]|nr:extracellular solute-binding protein [Clostridiales bacterium]
MKKLLSLLLALTMLLGVVPALAEEQEPVSLTLWTFQEPHTQFFEKMLDLYNEQTEGPKIVLDMQVYPYEEMHNKLTIALQSGEGAPDITDIEINMFANYLKGDIQLEPLNDIVEPIADHLVMSRFENYAKDGNYYGIDHHIGATVAFYNTEILEQAGVDYKDIKTWDDFREAGKKVLEATGKPITTWESNDCWSIYPLVNQHGGDWLTEDNEVRMDEQVVIDTLQFMHDMQFVDGTVQPAPGGWHHTEEYYGWMNGGGAAAVVMPFWYAARFLNYMPDLAGVMKVAPMPLWSDGGHKTAQMGGTGTAVVKTSEHLELAKDFLSYAKLSFEGNIQSWRILGNDPILLDVYGTDELNAPNQFFDFFGDDMFEVVESLLDDVPNTCLTDAYPSAADVVKSQMAYELVIAGTDPAEIAKNCAQELRDMIE